MVRKNDRDVIKPAFELRAVISLNSKGYRQPFHS